METITADQLLGIMPRVQQAATWRTVLNDALDRFEIDTKSRMAAFLAQIAHESSELNRLIENLSYSAQGLLSVWPKRFKSLENAKLYERNPQRIANFVYANRLGNGDTASGDGWMFRGRGVIQLTGRGNYRAIGNALGLPLESQPDLLLQPSPAALVAGYFWNSRGLNELADDKTSDDDDEDFVQITLRINGGRTGLADRRRYWAKAKLILGT